MLVLTKEKLRSVGCYGDKFVLRNNSKKIYIFDNTFNLIFKLEGCCFESIKIIILKRKRLGVEIKFNSSYDTFILTNIDKIFVVQSKILSEKMIVPCFSKIENSQSPIELYKNIEEDELWNL